MRLIENLREGRWASKERLKVYPRLFLVLFLMAALGWIALSSEGRDLSGKPLGPDFLNVYAAGVMTHRGQAALVYDWPTQHSVEIEVMGGQTPFYGWHYPPFFLVVAYAVAFLPFGLALLVYLALGFLAYFETVRRCAPNAREALWALAAFPGVFVNGGNGQNGLITTSLMGSGFLFLRQSPWISGVFFGLLAYKPQFFALIPLALFFGGERKAAFASLLVAGATLVGSWAVFGDDVLRAFWASTKLTQHIVLEQGDTGWGKIQSVFSMVRSLGGGLPAAYGAQGLVALCALGSVLWIWRREASFETKAAALTAGALLITPYLLDYDLVVLALPIAFLARQGTERGFLPYEKTLLAALWLLPLVARFSGAGLATPTPLFLGALLGLCLIRRLSRSKAAAATG